MNADQIKDLLNLMTEAEDAGINIRQLNALRENAESKSQAVSDEDIQSMIEKARRS